MKQRLFSLIMALAALTAFADGSTNSASMPAGSLAKDSRVFELRTYHAVPGKLEALHARFRNVANKLFAKHGMQVIGYWEPMNKVGQHENTLVYVLAFPNLEARDRDWKEFASDPEWQAARADSEKNGPLLAGKPESVLMTATDYSPMK